MGSSRRSFVLVAACAVALAAAGRWHPVGATAIDSAQISVRSSDHAARSTEPIRYEDAGLTLLASYPIAHGDPVDDAKLTARDRAVWAIVVATLPEQGRDTIRQLNVVSDGVNGTLAMVHRSTVDSSTWVLSIDPAESREVLVSTLVHEYGHMLTLRSEDLKSAAASRDSCKGVRIEIGCASAGSALAAWHDEFWANTAEPTPPDAKRFVSDYAASSVHEDLAESFMAWTLNQVRHPTPAISERFAFFAARPEFVQARDEITAKLNRP